MALTDLLTQIADSIRSKDGTTDKIAATEFPQRILDISSGGRSDLPDNVKTGTFTVAEDTVETITIPHALGTTPIMVFVFPDNPDYAINNISYALMGGVDLGTVKLVTTSAKTLAEKYNVCTIEVDDTNIVITISSTMFKLIAGLVYRWIAWG